MPQRRTKPLPNPDREETDARDYGGIARLGAAGKIREPNLDPKKSAKKSTKKWRRRRDKTETGEPEGRRGLRHRIRSLFSAIYDVVSLVLSPFGRLPLTLQTISFGAVAMGIILGAMWWTAGRFYEGDRPPGGGLTARWMLPGELGKAGRAVGDEEALAAEGPLLVFAEQKTPVGALIDGEVVFAEVVSGFGGWVAVETSGGGLTVNTMYLEGALPQVGASVARGSKIGEVGRIGDSLGHGVMVEILADGAPTPINSLFLTTDEFEGALWAR